MSETLDMIEAINDHEHHISEFTRIQNERDALLEALKMLDLQLERAVDLLPSAQGYSELDGLVQYVRAALANVEGKDG